MDTATNGQEKTVKKEKLVVPVKTTLNLCMKEKAAISPVLFITILVVILALALVIGYFGVYKPYQSVKEKQEELNAAKAELQQVLDKINDYDDVKKEYNRYNYEDYDKTIADRLDVLALLEKDIFPVANVRSIMISQKSVTITISGISSQGLSDLINKLTKRDLVASVEPHRGSSMDDSTEEGSGESLVDMTISLNDAGEGGN